MNPFLQARAPGYQGAPKRKPPQFGPKPIPDLGGRPNPSPPHQMPGGTPGPTTVGGNMNQNGRPVAPLGADWGWRNLTPQQRQQQGGIPQLDGRPNPDGPRGIPGGSPGPVIGPGQGGGGTGGGTGGGGMAGLPLDPVYEAQMRLIEDSLAAQLGPLAGLRAQIAAQTGLQGERLNTNEGVDKSRLLESLAARGAFGGGIQRQDEGYLGTDYLRQRQDLANAAAGQYGDVAVQEGNARLSYLQQLQEALLASADRSLSDPYAVIDQGGGGGGGGNWKPSWTPKNKRKAGR